MPVSWLDVLLIVIMLISGFLAMLRGLTREVLAIMSWALAAGTTLLIWPRYRKDVQQYIQPDLLADAVLGIGVFIIALIIVSLITTRFSDKVLDSRVGALDRTLGFVFGLARGLILVVIVYLFLSPLMPEKDHPNWVREARSLPLIEQTGQMILSLVPEDPLALIPGVKNEATAPGKQSQRIEYKSNHSSSKSRGYRSGERRGINQLFESTQSSQ